MLKALLVDDEPVVLKALKVLIDWNELGYCVCGEAIDGKRAFQLILHDKPDVVITDIRMPAQDGLALIKQCRQQGLVHIRFIILSGYGDFQYAQQAIKFGVTDYFLKPLNVEALAETLKKMSKDLVLEKSQLQLVQESMVYSAKSQVRHFLKSGWWLDHGQIAALSSSLNISEATYARYVKVKLYASGLEQDKLDAFSGKIIEFLENNYRFFSVDTTNTSIDLLYFYEEEQKFLLSDFFSALMKEMLEVIAVRAKIIIGREGKGLESLPASMNSFEKLENDLCFYTQKDVLLYEDFENVSFQYSLVDIVYTEKIIANIADNDFAGVDKNLNELFGSLEDQHICIDAVKIILNNIAIECIRLLNDLHGDSRVIQNEAGYLNSLDALTVEEAKEKTLRLCFRIIHIAEALKKQNFKGVIREAEVYAKSNYMNDINLNLIANMLHINSAYLGQQFKKKTGMKFNDYLNLIRIEAAKKYLIASDLKVYEIAEKVGFKNTYYFTNIFKKLEQVSPTEYRG